MYINVKESKNALLVTELNSDYTLEFRKTKEFQPEIFVESSNPESKYRSLIDNSPLDMIKFDSIREFKSYLYDMKNVSNSGIYGDVQCEYQYIRENYKNQKLLKSRFWYLDIETDIPPEGFPNPESTPSEITLIQISESDNDTTYLFGHRQSYTPTEKNVRYFLFENEKEMLKCFVDFLHNRTPSIVCAWNGDGFDYPYIVNRMEKIGLDPKILSPFNQLEEHKTVIFGKTTKFMKPVGYVWLDMIEMYKKSDPSGKENWKLEYMSKYVLGDEEGGKMDYTKRGYRDMKNFILNKYDPELDKYPNSELKETYDSDIERFNQHWYDLFIYYGIIDVYLLKKMDEKIGLSNTLIDLSHTMGCNVYDVFATVKPWQIHIYNELYERGQFIPQKSPFDFYRIPGGHVSATPGIYKWVVSEDYTSLYPFCLIGLNLSPETYVPNSEVPDDLRKLLKPTYRYADEENKIYSEDIYFDLPEEHKNKITELAIKYDYCIAPNGTCYKKSSKGILPELTQGIYDDRKKFKKLKKESEKKVEECKKSGSDFSKYENEVQVYDTRQLTRKLLINAEYGFLGNEHSNIANSDIAGAITCYGRLNLKATGSYLIEKLKELNDNFNISIIQRDTDSIYICLESVVEQYLKVKPDLDKDKIVELLDIFTKTKIQPILDESSRMIAERFNARENCLNLDREIIADSFLSSRKKRYACRIFDDEGTRLTTPKKKIVGLDIKRSDTPSDVRIRLSNVLDFIFDDDNEGLIDFIEEYKETHKTLNLEEISIPSGVSDITKFERDSSLSIPMHVRASMVFNLVIERNSLREYQRINNGDKIKFIFLKKNPITNSEVIAFNDPNFLYDIGLDKYIDYERLFDRTFISPVKGLTEIIGWKIERSDMILSLF